MTQAEIVLSNARKALVSTAALASFNSADLTEEFETPEAVIEYLHANSVEITPMAEIRMNNAKVEVTHFSDDGNTICCTVVIVSTHDRQVSEDQEGGTPIAAFSFGYEAEALQAAGAVMSALATF